MSARGTKRRSTRQAVDRKQSRSIYYEPDSEEDDQSSEDDELAVEYQPASKRRKAKPQTRATVQTRREPSRPRARKTKFRDHKKQPIRKRLGAPLKPKTNRQTQYTGPSDNKIPNWASLPVDILQDVFTFAAQQLNEPATRYAN